MAIQIQDLHYAYHEHASVFKNLSLTIPDRARTLLVGANGVGKSTLLRLLGGYHLVSAEAIQIYGASPFHQPSLMSDIAFVDGEFPITLDLRVHELTAHGRDYVDERKETELLKLLEIDLNWRMHQVSDGQRRRVQLMLALRRKIRLLLLDEVTTHLDVLVRSDFLAWLKDANEKEGLSIVYTTHIFDGLWTRNESPWPTHLCFLKKGALHLMKPVGEIPELAQAIANGEPSPLLSLCERWMRMDLKKTL